MVIIDDSYVFSPPRAIFPAINAFAEDLKKAGLKFNHSKSQCYIAEEYRDEEWEQLRGDIPNGTIVDEDETIHHGITVCNVPVGSDEFVETYLQKRLKLIRGGYRKIAALLDPGRWPNPEIPSRQMLWILLLICLQSMGNYWLQHVWPDHH